MGKCSICDDFSRNNIAASLIDEDGESFSVCHYCKNQYNEKQLIIFRMEDKKNGNRIRR